jgi:hypothetical protein
LGTRFAKPKAVGQQGAKETGMKKPDGMAQNQLSLGVITEEPTEYDRHGYLRPWRYFRFYMLYDPNSRRTCWLPEGYEV